MYLRIRGKGASPENSQAAIMHLRGFRHVAVQPPQMLNVFTSFDRSVLFHDQRPFPFVHFATGINAITLTERQKLCDWQTWRKINVTDASITGTNDKVVDADQVVNSDEKQVDAFEHERRLIWKETWNLYDIMYDDVPLLPSSYTFTNNMFTQLHELANVIARCDSQPILHSEEKESNLQNKEESRSINELLKFEPIPASLYKRPLSWQGNKKAVVCTHYYAPEAIAALELERQQLPSLQNMQIVKSAEEVSSVATATSLTSNGAANVNAQSEDYTSEKEIMNSSNIIVLDVRNIAHESTGSRLALELAWLAAFLTIQDCNYLFSTFAIVVRLPFDHVPSIHYLLQLREKLINNNHDNEDVISSIDEISNDTKPNTKDDQNPELLEKKQKKDQERANNNLLSSLSLLLSLHKESKTNLHESINCVIEALDFLAEHLTLLHSNFSYIYHHSTQKLNSNINNNNNNVDTNNNNEEHQSLYEECKKKDIANQSRQQSISVNNFTTPQMCFIDKSSSALQDTLSSLCTLHNKTHHNATENVIESCKCNVVYVVGDHHRMRYNVCSNVENANSHTNSNESDLMVKSNVNTLEVSHEHSANTTHDAEEEKKKEEEEELELEYQEHIARELNRLPFICTHVTLIAPLRALIDDDEESWDPYVQRERARLNYCPCCNHCSHTHEQTNS